MWQEKLYKNTRELITLIMSTNALAASSHLSSTSTRQHPRFHLRRAAKTHSSSSLYRPCRGTFHRGRIFCASDDDENNYPAGGAGAADAAGAAGGGAAGAAGAGGDAGRFGSWQEERGLPVFSWEKPDAATMASFMEHTADKGAGNGPFGPADWSRTEVRKRSLFHLLW